MDANKVIDYKERKKLNEKSRRDKIGSKENELKELVLEHLPELSTGSKLEKADILDHTVTLIKKLVSGEIITAETKKKVMSSVPRKNVSDYLERNKNKKLDEEMISELMDILDGKRNESNHCRNKMDQDRIQNTSMSNQRCNPQNSHLNIQYLNQLKLLELQRNLLMSSILVQNLNPISSSTPRKPPVCTTPSSPFNVVSNNFPSSSSSSSSCSSMGSTPKRKRKSLDSEEVKKVGSIDVSSSLSLTTTDSSSLSSDSDVQLPLKISRSETSAASSSTTSSSASTSSISRIFSVEDILNS